MCLHGTACTDCYATRGHVVVRPIAACQLGDLAIVISQVEAQIPREVILYNRLGVDGKLNTLILQRTDVSVHLILEVRSSRYVDVVDQVIRAAEVVIHGTGQATVEETIVEASVIRRCALPLQILVVSVGAIRFAFAIANGVVGKAAVGGVGGKVGVVRTDVLLTRHTITEAELEVRQCIYILQESLFLHLPTEGERGEGTPAVILVEARGTVATDSSGEEVLIGQGVVQAAEEGDEVVLRSPLFARGGVFLAGVHGVSRRIEACVAVIPLAVEVLPLVADHDVEVVDAHGLHVLQVAIEGEVVLVNLLKAVAAVVVVREGVGPDVRRLLTGGEVHATVGVDAQVGQEVELIVRFKVAH